MAAPRIEPSELLSIADFDRRREAVRKEIIAVRDLRRVEVGPWVSFTFENRKTVLYQIQEMIRIERITDPAKIREEIETYEELLPGPRELSATMFIEISDAAQRDRALSKLGGIEKRISLKFGRTRIRARDKRPIDPRFERPGRASAVYYLGFALPGDPVKLMKSGSAALEITHANYGHAAALSPKVLAALNSDLRH